MKLTLEKLRDIIGQVNNSKNRDFKALRIIVNSQIAPDDEIPVEAWGTMLKLRHLLYNPADSAIYGKETEVRDRLRLLRSEGKQFVKWREFSAHDRRRADIISHETGRHWDVKTTVSGGNFLYSKTTSDFEKVVQAYSRRTEWINYKNEEYGIDIFCSWKDFFDYLRGYNDKGLSTWFFTKPSVSLYGEITEYVFKMQVVRTSQKKLNYLRNYGKGVLMDEEEL